MDSLCCPVGGDAGVKDGFSGRGGISRRVRGVLPGLGGAVQRVVPCDKTFPAPAPPSEHAGRRALPAPGPKRRPIHTHRPLSVAAGPSATALGSDRARARGATPSPPLPHSSLTPPGAKRRGARARERGKPSFHHLPLHLLAPPSWRSTCACIRCWCSCIRCSCARCAAWRAVASRSFFGRFKSFCSR